MNKIKLLSEISVRQFMLALFNKQRDEIEDWDALYLLYVDTSGFGETKEYELMAEIHNIQSRLHEITNFLETQKNFLLHFDAPLEYYKNKDGEIVNTFAKIRKYGHKLTWQHDKQQFFVTQLKTIDLKERKKVSKLDIRMKELAKLKTEGVKEDHSSRADFIRMLNNLNKANYTIDKDKTDMEELCLMIKQHNDDAREAADRNKPI